VQVSESFMVCISFLSAANLRSFGAALQIIFRLSVSMKNKLFATINPPKKKKASNLRYWLSFTL
jgi:hypothetical protein